METKIIKCRDCGTKLAEAITTQTNDRRISKGLKTQFTKYIVKCCPKCNGESFKSGIFEGTIYVGALTDNLQINLENTDIIEEDDKVVVLLTLNLIQKL